MANEQAPKIENANEFDKFKATLGKILNAGKPTGPLNIKLKRGRPKKKPA